MTIYTKKSSRNICIEEKPASRTIPPCFQQVNQTWARDPIEKPVPGQRSTSKNTWPRWAVNLSPRYGQRIPCFDRCQLIITWMQGWYYVDSLTGQWHVRVQTESQIATADSCFGLFGSLQHGEASCEVCSCSTDIHKPTTLSFQRSISLASLFTSLSIFGWSGLLQILRKQAAFSFAVLCIII